MLAQKNMGGILRQSVKRNIRISRTGGYTYL